MSVARSLLASILVLFITSDLSAAERSASSADDVAGMMAELKPGDTLVLADGVWTDQKIHFKAKGTEASPVTLCARTRGKVVLTGESSLIVEGHHIVVSGLYFKDVRGPKDAIAIPGSHCRLTECAVEGGTTKFFVHLIGPENRMDHCYLAGKTSESPTLQIEAPATAPNNDRIDHNHFGPRAPLGRNGGETIRVGYSGQSMNDSRSVVELNLFDRCDGEIEIISSKSCENVYRFNTFLDCAGMLTLRHGNRCVVDSNFFLAHHKKGSAGIRVIGEGHSITNNFIDGVDKGGFWITSGVPNSALNQYFRAERCVISFNTVVDSAGPCLDLSAGLGTSGRTLKPMEITITNNLFAVGARGQLLKGSEGEGYQWLGNLAQSDTPPPDHSGIRVCDLKLKRSKDGLLRPSSESPALGAAEGKFFVKNDIEGQPRGQKPDVGCDQLSTAPVTNRPLAAADVGPAWMPRNSGEQTPVK